MAIVHPWMPWYRLAFFDRLREALAADGVELDVAHGGPPPYATGRSDARSLGWARPLAERRLTIAGRSINFRRPWKPALEADLLVIEDGLRNVDSWLYLATRKLMRRPIAFWGHGRTMDKEVTGLEASAKDWMVRQGDWWFAYTQGVADRLVSSGLPGERITALGNTFDTDELAEAARSVSERETERLAEELGLVPGHSALYIGGLSRSKNLDLLIEASRIALAEDPLLKVVIAGAGPDRERLESLAGDAPVVFTGPVFDSPSKAALASACDVMVLPGLVGLAAVDSFVLGLPAVAVSPWNHCPEFEYLESGTNSLVVAPRAPDYAEALLAVIGDPGLSASLRAGCADSASRYTLDSMVERFSAGVIEALARGRAGR